MPLNTAIQNPNTFNVLAASPSRVGIDRGSCSWYERPLSGNNIGDRLQIVDLWYATFYWGGSGWINEALLPDGSMVVGGAKGIGIKVNEVDPSFTWRDLEGPIQPKSSGAGTPSWSTFRGDIKGWKFIAGDVVDSTFHMPHDWAGTDIYLHFHWAHNGTAINGPIVLTHRWTYAKGHGQSTYPVQANFVQTVAAPVVAAAAQYAPIISENQFSRAAPGAGEIPLADLEPDGLIKVSTIVTTAPVVTGGGFFIEYIDIHYQSTNIGTHGKSPPFFD